ncbi:hypothetical protein NXC24_PB00430 (plasmid) [Rhizobium sp. NXC24]|nr:hypothetical protein NXC24_PB00430 [Rhizobium sp. NXC24]
MPTLSTHQSAFLLAVLWLKRVPAGQRAEPLVAISTNATKGGGCQTFAKIGASSVHQGVSGKRDQNAALRDADPHIAFVHCINDLVGVKSVIGKDRMESEAFDQTRHVNPILRCRQEFTMHKLLSALGRARIFA